MATTNYAIHIDEQSGLYAPLVFRTPATAPLGGVRVIVPDESDNVNSGVTVFAVTGATNATPIVLTVPTGHGVVADDIITVQGVGGITAANGTFRVTSVTATTITLLNSAGNAAFTTAGTASKRTKTANIQVALAKGIAAVLNDLSSQN